MRLRYTILAGGAAMLCAAIYGVAADTQPKLPPPFHSPSVNNGPKVVAKPADGKLILPKGFTIEEYKSGFRRPRMMLLGPSKELLLSDAVPREGKVILFHGSEQKDLITDLDRPFGMAWWKEYLYVAETTSVKRYKYDKKAMTVGKGEEVVNMKDFGKGHWTRCIEFDRKGETFYLGIGSESNVAPGEPALRAAISRYNPDGSGMKMVAEGTRNPTSIHLYPGTDNLFAAVQERDLLGDDLVPDYFTMIKPGGFYGWPYSYIGPNEDPRNKGQKPELVAKTIVPDVPLGAHVAVLDFHFYTGKLFPKEYQGGAFVALHGSWNRAQRVGQTVVYLPFKNGKPTGEIKDFLSGWMLGPDKKEVWGRPVGIQQLPDGSLLVTDDGGNKIWRITYKG